MISTEMEPNRQRKCTCCKPSLGRMISMIMYLLLLLAELVVTFTFIYYFGKSISPVFTSESRLKTTNVSSSTKNAFRVFPIQLVRYFGMTEAYSRLIMALNCLDTVNCWIFLGAVFISPHFTGFCPLPKFWTLLFVFVLFVIGDVIESTSSSIVASIYKFRAMVAVCFTFSLNAFFVTMILGVLNEMKICHMAPGQVYLIFKGALIIFCFRLLVYFFLIQYFIWL